MSKTEDTNDRGDDDLASVVPSAMLHLLKNSAVGFFQTRLDGSYVFANQFFAELMGFDSVEELIASGVSAVDFYADPDDMRILRERNAEDESVYGHVLQARRVDGTTFWAQEHSSSVRDDAGQITGYVGSVTNIDNLISTQQRLKDAEASYRRIFERVSEGIYRSSLDGKQLRSNPALYKLNGYNSEDEHLAAVKDIATEWYVDPNRREEFKRALEENGVVEDFESEIYRHNSRERIWIAENAYLVRADDGTPLYYEGTVKEITTRKQAEIDMAEALHAAESANRAKSAFLANMSHELRTPLNAILGFSDILSQEDMVFSPEKTREYAKDIHDSGDFLLELINDVLDLARVESGTKALDLQTLSIRETIEETFVTLRPIAEKASVSLLNAISGDCNINADARAIRQCILNLMSNAIRHAPADSIVTISTTIYAAEDCVDIIVQDQGPGVPADIVNRVGEPFVTNANAKLRNSKNSTGLGLAITKSLIEAMSGTLTLTNGPDGGCQAILTIPLVAS